MKANIVRIGNSQGIRIPKIVIEQCGFEQSDQLELKIEANNLIISKPRKTREGWDKAFAIMHKNGDDKAIDTENLTNNFDNTEWTW